MVLLVAVLLASSLGLYGMAKVNVWVRDANCEIVNRTGHLHVLNCHGTEVLGQTFYNGHAEVDLPPGCYIIKAGLFTMWHQNIYTDRAIVIVKCGEETCVNLLLPGFVFIPLAQLDPQQLVHFYCQAAILPALIANAMKAGIHPKELDQAINVIAKAASMDKNLLLDAVRAEMKLVRENIGKYQGEEEKEGMEFLRMLEKYVQK
jgi:hypothetical protein